MFQVESDGIVQLLKRFGLGDILDEILPKLAKQGVRQVMVNVAA